MIRAKWLLPSLFLALCPVPFISADPPAPKPSEPPPIVLPEVVPVAPVPAPSPSITKLNADELYVVSCDDALQVLASPEGIVTITEDAGPIKIRAKFAGNTKSTTRTVKEAHVYSVEATSTGRVELLITRVGQTKPAIRRTLDVTNGPAPVPPGPGPGPIPPGPGPGPTPPPGPVTSFHVVFVYESGDTLTAAQNSVLYAKSVKDYLDTTTTKDTTTTGWRRYDRDVDTTNESPTFKALWAAVKPQLTTVPCIVIEVNGKADILPLPATPADAIALFKKYNGGK